MLVATTLRSQISVILHYLLPLSPSLPLSLSLSLSAPLFSPLSLVQLIWKFVASEEDYVSQLTVLTEEFHKQCEIGAHSCNPPLTLDQCDTIFRNRYLINYLGLIVQSINWFINLTDR